MPPIGRRTVLKLVSGAMAGASLPWPGLAQGATAQASTPAQVGDSQIGLAFDEAMRTQVSAFGQPITGFDSSETLLLAEGPLDTFVHRDQRSERLRGDRHGAGKRTVVRGVAANGVEK